MKIELAWVDNLLGRWGQWSIRCESGALGFASGCVLSGSSGGRYDSTIPLGVLDEEDLEAVDGSIRRLPSIHREVILQLYKFGNGWTDRRNANTLGISYKTLTQYVNQAHRKIAFDISLQCTHNSHQSVIGGNAPDRKQPVSARA